MFNCFKGASLPSVPIIASTQHSRTNWPYCDRPQQLPTIGQFIYSQTQGANRRINSLCAKLAFCHLPVVDCVIYIYWWYELCMPCLTNQSTLYQARRLDGELAQLFEQRAMPVFQLHSLNLQWFSQKHKFKIQISRNACCLFIWPTKLPYNWPTINIGMWRNCVVLNQENVNTHYIKFVIKYD